MRDTLDSDDIREIVVSFRDTDTNASLCPYATRIYSSAEVSTQFGTNVTEKEYEVVTKDTEIRVITVTFNIYDIASGDLVESRTITRLQ